MGSDKILDALEKLQEAALSLGRKLNALFIAQALCEEELELSADNELIALAEAAQEYDALNEADTQP